MSRSVASNDVLRVLDQLLGRDVSQMASLTLSEDIDTALDNMDLIVHHIHQHQQHMRERRNDLSKTCRLPREILARIFQFCTPTSYPFQRPQTFLSFSHVCRHWRQVALDYPAIWTQLDLTLGEAVTTIMFRRAKSAPFSFFGDITHCGVEFLQEVADACTNVVTLHLIGTHGALDLFVKRLKGPMPLLTSLTISFSIEHELSSFDYPLQSPALGDFVHSRLRCLRLSNVTINWSSKCISNLTTLEISIPRVSPSELPTILHAIARNPSLETLILSVWKDTKSWNNSIPLVLSERIALNSLQKLVLGAPTCLVLDVLHNLIHPSLCYVRVQNLDYCTSTTVMRSLYDAIESRCPSPDSIQNIRFSTPYRFVEAMCVAINHDFPPLSEYKGSGSLQEFNVTFLMTKAIFMATYDQLSSMAPRITALNWGVDSEENIKPCLEKVWNWAATLGSLETTIINGQPLTFILETFETYVASILRYGPEAEPDAPFPSLRTLRMTHVSLHVVDRIRRMTNLRRLATVMSQLKAHGRLSLRAIIMDKCYVKCPVSAVARQFGLSDIIESRGEEILHEYPSVLDSEFSADDADPDTVAVNNT